MASCKLMIESSVTRMQNTGVLSKDMRVLNKEVFEAESNRIRKDIQLRFNKDFKEPIGTIESGRLQPNRHLEMWEKSLQLKAAREYDGVTYRPFPLFKDGGWEAKVEVSNIADIMAGTSPGIQVRQIGTEEWTHTVSMGYIHEKTDIPGVKKFFGDILSFENYPVLTMGFPGFMNPVLENMNRGRILEKELLYEAQKSSVEDALDALVYSHGGESLDILNKHINSALLGMGVKWQGSIRRLPTATAGNASRTVASVDVVQNGLLNNTDISVRSATAKTWVHEKTHILSNALLHDKTFYKKMENLYNEALKHGTAEDHYGLTNVKEFISEAVSNRRFQEFLGNIKYQATEKTLLEKFIDYIMQAIEAELNINLDGTLLREVITLTINESSKRMMNKEAMYNIDDVDFHYLRNISLEDGTYQGTAPDHAVAMWANKYNLVYDAHSKKFYYNNPFRTELGRAAIDNIVAYSPSDYAFEADYGPYSVHDLFAGYTKNDMGAGNAWVDYKVVDRHNVNGDLEALKAMNRTKVDTPSEETHGKYHINTVPHYRATQYLGFGADPSPLLENANRIGNVADELAKRVFTEGYERQDYTYEKVNAFVKKELWQALKDDDPSLKRADFEAEFKNAVDEESFYDLMEDLEKMKKRLMDEFDVVEFIPDLVVWDTEKLVAGEIDILAKHSDGSYTVIDMKTRRKGLVDYHAPQIDDYNTHTKHTRQTSLYSQMLEQLGFKVNDPMIIIAQPQYGTDPVDNQPFVDIIEGSKVSLIKLTREKDLFDFNLGPEGSYNRDIRNKILGKHTEYEQWYRKQMGISDLITQTGDTEHRNRKIETLQKKLQEIQYKIEEYRNILRKGKSGAVTEGLAEVQNRIKEQLKKSIDETAIIEQLIVMEDFFLFGEEQLKLLANQLENDEDMDAEAQRDAYFQIQNYKGLFETAKELSLQLEELRKQGFITPEEYARVKKVFNQFSSLNADLDIRLKAKIKELAKTVLMNSFLGSKFEIKMRDQFRREAEDMFSDLKGKEKEQAVQDYINKQRRNRDNMEKLQEEYAEEIDELLNGIHYDMSQGAFLFNSDVEVNNPHVQLMHNMILQSKQQFSTVVNSKLQELAQLKKELGLSRKELEQLIVTSEQGDHYLQGEYSIEFYDKIRSLQKAIADAEALAEKDPKLSRIKADQARKNLSEWRKQNTEWVQDTAYYKPIDKWKNKGLNKLSAEQKKALNYFRNIIKESTKATTQKRSLLETVGVDGVVYMRLPGVKQTLFGAVERGEGTKFYRKLYDETFTVEMDDTDPGFNAEDDSDKRKAYQTYTTLDGKQVYKVPVFFRGSPKEYQNKDLWTIYAMEIQNYVRYEIDSDLASRGTILLDAVNGTKFYKTAGLNREKVVNLFRAKGSTEATTIDGDASVVSKMILKMMKNNVYAMTQEYAGRIPGTSIDIHRASQLLSSYTAFASMSFKLLSAGNNWVTGNIAIALEAAGTEFFDKSDLASAKAIYAKNLMGIIGDIGSPVKHNMVNQLMNRFDTLSENSILNNEFEKDNALKQMLDPGYSLGGYQMGEHEMHATIMLAVLKGTKLVDRKGNWITRDGKTTKDRKEAMSMLDAYEIKDGVLTLNGDYSTTYTEHDTVNSIENGGEASLRGLIKDRVTRTMGAFDKSTQAEINRQWYGKLFVQFKKHILPQSLNRFRGLNKVQSEVADLDDRHKYFNLKAKTEEYGYYTTFLRHTLGVLKAHKWNILAYKEAGADRWKKMSKHERANMTKALSEFAYLAFMASLAALAAAAAEDDDDNAHLWAMAYLAKRQVGDAGMQFVDPEELWRLTDSPMAAMRNVNGLIDTISQLFNPGEDYVSGVNAGKNKLLTKAQRLFLLDRMRQFEDGFNKRLFTGISNY